MGLVRQPLNPTFKTGDLARESGIYRARDPERGCAIKDVIVLKGETFPACPRCGNSASFEGREHVPHVREDPDFQGA